jgi:hypothetical protein
MERILTLPLYWNINEVNGVYMNFCMLSVISTFIRRRRSFPLDQQEKIIMSNLIKFKCEIELLCADSDSYVCLRHTILIL